MALSRGLRPTLTRCCFRLGCGRTPTQVFSTPSGRTVDLATAYVQTNSVMLVVSPSMTDMLVQKLDKCAPLPPTASCPESGIGRS